MGAQQVWHLSFMSIWMFVFSFLSVCSGMGTPKLSLESTVFVALSGEDLTINCEVKMPANQSRNVLTCSDPLHKQIYFCDVRETSKPVNINLKLELKNLTISGEYSCQYKSVKVYWFLRIRSEGYRQVVTLDYTELIIVAVFSSVLLVFSVVGSVCVFRGHGKDSECEDTGKKRKQKREERQEREMEENSMDVITDPSTSFYASLETRPRSIYDVLNHSASNKEPDQRKAKPRKKEPQQTMPQTTQDQNEGVFECVYENF